MPQDALLFSQKVRKQCMENNNNNYIINNKISTNL